MQINVSPPTADNATEWLAYIQRLGSDADNSKRKADSRKVWDYYDGKKQKTFLEAAMATIFTDPQSLVRKRKWVDNITKKIVDGLAVAYSDIIRRRVEGGSDLSTVWWDNLNPAMQSADKAIVLDGTTLLMARWSEVSQKIEYRQLKQFEFDLVYDYDSYGEKILTAVILSNNLVGKDSKAYVYTQNNTYIFSSSVLQTKIEHNANVLPFVVVHATDPGFDDYLDPNVCLTEANLELNLALSSLLTMLQVQAHGVWVLKDPTGTFTGNDPGIGGAFQSGSDDINSINALSDTVREDRSIDINDPNKMVYLYSENGELTNVKQQAEFQGAIDTIRFLSNSFADSMGLDRGIFDIQVASTATEVYFKETKRQAVLNQHRDIFGKAEKQLFSIALLLTNKITGLGSSVDSSTFTIDYISRAGLSETVGLPELISAFDKKCVDKIEVIRGLYPTLSREEAIAFAEEMEVDKKEEVAPPIVMAPVEEDEAAAEATIQ